MTHYSALMLSIGFDIAVRRVQPITETKAINKVKTAPASNTHQGKEMRWTKSMSYVCISFSQIGMAMTTATSELTRNLLASCQAASPIEAPITLRRAIWRFCWLP